MSDVTPTRSVVLEMKEERRAMHDGYVFLDEKCLLLAGEILRELQHYTRLRDELIAQHRRAMMALEAAVARHGLEGVQVYPARVIEGVCVRREQRALMGVRLQDAQWSANVKDGPPSVDRSPEAQACGNAFLDLMRSTPALAAVSGNLERLRIEYRRAVRRARALQDVLLPEIDRDVRQIEMRLEELEQEDAVTMRWQAAT